MQEQKMSDDAKMDDGVQPTPLDSIIARVREYAKKPGLVTPETMAELEAELVDLKSYVDGEDGDEREGMEEKSPSMTIMLGMNKGGKK